MNGRPENQETEPVVPARLVEALRSLHHQRPLVPPSVDKAVLSQARAYLSRDRSAGMRPSSGAATLELPTAKPASESDGSTGARPIGGPTHLAAAADGRAPVTWLQLPWGIWAAAAAVVVLGLGIGLLLHHRTGRPAVIAREDVDRNGKVNILDAFALARKLQRGGTAGAELDLNGDGVVDQRDIDWVAARAVKLHKG